MQPLTHLVEYIICVVTWQTFFDCVLSHCNLQLLGVLLVKRVQKEMSFLSFFVYISLIFCRYSLFLMIANLWSQKHNTNKLVSRSFLHKNIFFCLYVTRFNSVIQGALLSLVSANSMKTIMWNIRNFCIHLMILFKFTKWYFILFDTYIIYEISTAYYELISYQRQCNYMTLFSFDF